MGVTLLAAGTSVPDLITSVLVAKQGSFVRPPATQLGVSVEAIIRYVFVALAKPRAIEQGTKDGTGHAHGLKPVVYFAIRAPTIVHFTLSMHAQFMHTTFKR